MTAYPVNHEVYIDAFSQLRCEGDKRCETPITQLGLVENSAILELIFASQRPVWRYLCDEHSQLFEVRSRQTLTRLVHCRDCPALTLPGGDNTHICRRHKNDTRVVWGHPRTTNPSPSH